MSVGFLKTAFIVIIGCWVYVSAALLPFASTLPAVDTSYDDILIKTWEGIKKRMIDPYTIPLVHRSRSEEPGDAVSEGIGYGMLLALYCNDQLYFNKIWDAGEQYMWADDGKFYNWRVGQDGNVIGGGAASDADQDIALALIFADALVKKSTWSSFTSSRGADYATRAREIINTLWNSMVEEGRYLRPGVNWGGRGFVNPGYFAPAFYRVFDEFAEDGHDWAGLIDQCYQTIAASPGYHLGLVPDWMQPDGNYTDGGLGYNAYADGKFMYKDGIRVLWRIATDYLWYSDPRASAYVNNAYAFIKTPDRANFFQMDGSVATDNFVLGNEVGRPRAEHSELTVAMWACAAMAAGGPEAAEPFSNELLTFYEGGEYWGRAADAGDEDTLHNEMYFEQFLAWFGASLISGVFTNLWDDFKDPNSEIIPDFIVAPKITPFAIDANNAPLSIKAVFNKSVRWNVEIHHRDDRTAVVVYGGNSDTIDLRWYGISFDGRSMLQGAYYVTISARGLGNPYSEVIWLGRPLDLKVGSRLIVDNFSDGDLQPFFGSGWGSHTEQRDGKNGATTITRCAVARNDSPPALHWAFRLDGSAVIGFNPYAALEWRCAIQDTTFTLAGLDTIIFRARSAAPLKVSVQLITSDIGDYTFFEDSVTLGSEMKEYALAIDKFTQRLNGSGRQLDLSKCTAIRFQVQDIDGTQNEIVMEYMHFSGNLASLYSSPPPYIHPDPGLAVHKPAKRGTCATTEGIRMIRHGASVRFEFPVMVPNSVLELMTITGKSVKHLMVSSERAVTWDYTDNSGLPVHSGCYIARLKTRSSIGSVLPVHVIR